MHSQIDPQIFSTLQMLKRVQEVDSLMITELSLMTTSQSYEASLAM